MRKSSATGFVAQEKLMTYATPQIEHIKHGGFADWITARGAAGLDWEPTLVPIAPIVDGAARNPIPDAQAVMNGGRYISVTSNRYHLIDHNLLGKVVTAVQEVYNNANITALVVLDGGRRIGVRITHGRMSLPFDPSPIDMETWVWLRHDAKGSLYIAENAHRLHCTNQLGFHDRGVATDLRVRHTGDIEAKIDLLVESFTRKADWEKWEKEMSELSITHVPANAFDRFLQEWIPMPTDPEVSTTRAENAQRDLFGLWQGYKTELGPNLYAAYQAITEYEDQHRTARGPAGLFNRAVQPNPRKEQALETLRELVTA